MKRQFNFSLEKILDLRKMATKKIMQEMAFEVEKLNRIEEAKLLAKKNLAKLDFDQKDSKSIDQRSWQNFQLDYWVHLKKLSQGLELQAKKQSQRLIPWQEKLLEARKQEKGLELIKERRRLRWKRGNQAREARELEEKLTWPVEKKITV